MSYYILTGLSCAIGAFFGCLMFDLRQLKNYRKVMREKIHARQVLDEIIAEQLASQSKEF